jgi:hypothetical protein
MEPIVPIVETKAASSPARGTLADLLAFILACLAALTALSYSILFFSRFLENDTHFWGIASAFLLCFGVGAFGYVPAALTARIAWKSHKSGATKRGLVIALLLIVPWFILAISLVFVSDMPKLYSLPIALMVILMGFWAVISLRKIK